MRILVVNFQDRRHPFAGGAEVHLHELFGRLAARGHDVTVLACGWRGSPPRECVDGLDIHRVGSRATFPVLARRYFRRHLPGPWHVIVDDFNKVPLCAHRWSDTPTVLMAHHLFGRTVFSAVAWPVALGVWGRERMLGRLYAGVPVVAVSESTADDLVMHGIEPRRISVIPNGTARACDIRVAPVRSDSPTLLYLGRLQPYKRVDVLLCAMACLAERGVQASLEIAGDGSMRSRLERLCVALHLQDRVHFRGHVSEARKQELLAGASIHVTASEKEGWGLSVLEAGAHGVPTIATWAPGLRDSVIHERTGRFVPVRDPVAFADAVEALLSQPALRRRLGEGARCFASLHSWETAADATEALLSGVADGNTLASPRTRLVQRPPFQSATIPRLGTGYAPYGAQRVVIDVWRGAANSRFAAVVGSVDAAGRWPAIEFEAARPADADRLSAPPGAHHRRLPDGRIIWELFAWPDPVLAWLERTVGDRLGERNVHASWAPMQPERS